MNFKRGQKEYTDKTKFLRSRKITIDIILYDSNLPLIFGIDTISDWSVLPSSLIFCLYFLNWSKESNLGDEKLSFFSLFSRAVVSFSGSEQFSTVRFVSELLIAAWRNLSNQIITQNQWVFFVSFQITKSRTKLKIWLSDRNKNLKPNIAEAGKS